MADRVEQLSDQAVEASPADAHVILLMVSGVFKQLTLSNLAVYIKAEHDSDFADTDEAETISAVWTFTGAPKIEGGIRLQQEASPPTGEVGYSTVYADTSGQVHSIDEVGTDYVLVRSDRSITLTGTANEVDISAGAQDLSADRTWTIGLPASVAITTALTVGGTAVSIAGHSHTASDVTDFDTEVGNHTDVAANTTHRSSDGSDHSFLDQSVISGASPTFVGTNFTSIPAAALGGVLQDLDTLGVSASDGQFIVATGVGAFAYESGATARTSLGLGNVENTALSTWAGTSSITTVGTLASGAISSGFGDIDIGASTFDTTGAVSVGALTSTGIDDNATSVAITIDSSDNVGIGTASPHSDYAATIDRHLLVNGDIDVYNTIGDPELTFLASFDPDDDRVLFNYNESSGRFRISTAQAKTTGATFKEAIAFFGIGTSTQTVVINDEGQDTDFRVETAVVNAALFVEGSSGKVAVGASGSLTGNFSVVDTTSAANVILDIKTGAGGGTSEVTFSDNANARGRIYFDHTAETLVLETIGSPAITINNSQGVTLASTLSAGATTIDTTLVLASGSITDSSGALSFGNENVSWTGTAATGALTVTGGITISSGALIRLDGGGDTYIYEPVANYIELITGGVTALQLDPSQNATFSGAGTFGGDLTVSGNTVIATKTPASAAATGTVGEIAWDSSYIYICVATDTWERAALASW